MPEAGATKMPWDKKDDSCRNVGVPLQGWWLVAIVDATHRLSIFSDCGLLSSWRTTVSQFCFTTYEMDKISCHLVEPQCKSKNPRGLQEVSLPLARMGLTALWEFQ